MNARQAKTKVRQTHLDRKAYVFSPTTISLSKAILGDSFNKPLTMIEVARNLGWRDEDILTFDPDTHLYGGTSSEGYKKIIGDIESGRVGALFLFNLFRAIRSFEDIQAFYRICKSNDTLIIVEEDLYDLNDPADKLLLSIKSFLTEGECQYIQKRMHEAKVRRAQQGMLQLPLPIGYRRGVSGQIIKDPNLMVQEHVELVFNLFNKQMEPAAIVKYFTHEDRLFPSRPQGGLHSEKIHWKALTYQRVRNMLQNPIYAGAYTYGRTRAESQVLSRGEIPHRKRIASVKQKDWIVCLSESHEGYITWQNYLEIQCRFSLARTSKSKTDKKQQP